jgi:hypothetical protein
MELDSAIEGTETPEIRSVKAVPNVPGLTQPTRMVMAKVQQVLMKVNPMETRRNNRIKKQD